jgi:hypothetical protein
MQNQYLLRGKLLIIWIPAFAGMTQFCANELSRIKVLAVGRRLLQGKSCFNWICAGLNNWLERKRFRALCCRVHPSAQANYVRNTKTVWHFGLLLFNKFVTNFWHTAC